MATIVHQYGLPLGPSSHKELVREQIRSAHDYRNALVQIECERRAEERTLIGASHELEIQVAQADAAVVAAYLVLGNARAETRSKKNVDPRLAQAVRDAKAVKSALMIQLHEVRTANKTAQQGARDQLHDRTLGRYSEASAASDATWGTKQAIVAAAQDSFGDTPLYEGQNPKDPRFKPWALAKGVLAVHLQNSAKRTDKKTGKIVPAKVNTIATTKIHQPNRWVWIEPVDPRAFLCETPRGERRRLQRTVLHLRIGTDERREPIMATFPMIMHRPLPAGRISWAKIYVRRIGPREEWTVSLTFDLEEAHRVTPGGGVVALDLGWRQMMDGSLRVATWVDHEKKTGTFSLSSSEGHLRERAAGKGAKVMRRTGLGVIQSLTRADSLRATRKSNFNVALAALVRWRQESRATLALPDWLTTEWRAHPQGRVRDMTHLHAWLSAGRLAALCRYWREHRFEGDEAAYGALEVWRHQDQHLWCWEAEQRESGLRRRREEYRKIARELADTYETIVLEKFDLRSVAEHAAPETTDEAENETARRNRHLVALSELREEIERAAGKSRVVRVPAEDSSHICPICGTVERFDAAVSLVHTYSCGHTWDQDEAAAHVIFARGERLREELTMGITRSIGNTNTSQDIAETKWQRVARRRTEKAARLAAARKPDSDAAE